MIPSTSKPQKLFSLLKHHYPIKASLFLCRICTETIPTPPPLENDDSTVKEAVQLLKGPDHEWDTTQLNHLLFSDSSSPRRLFQITRRLPSSSHALNFLQYLRSNSPFPHTQSLSFTFQAIFELASHEPDSLTTLSELYETSKAFNIPLTINATTLLLRRFGRGGLVEASLSLFNELEQSVKNTHVYNVMIDLLLRAGLVDDAWKMLDEMCQSNSECNCNPDDLTGDIVFSWLAKRERPGKNMSEKEIADLVLKLGEHGVLPNPVWMSQFISRLCRNGKTDSAWNVLYELMKSRVAVDVSSCNALLRGLERVKGHERMNQLMAKMKEVDIKPNTITFGILINHLCKSWRIDEAVEVLQKMIGGKDIGGVLIEPDVIMYNTVIDGLCKVGRQEEALDLMRRMRLQNGCAPNIITYNCLIGGFCKAGEIEKGKELFNAMNEAGIIPNIITVNSLIDGMCRYGRLNGALEFFNEMQKKGLKGSAATYTSLINAFCNVNNINKAMDIFNQIFRDGCIPDAIVYYTLINGLSQAGRMDDASSVLLKLKEAGFSPDIGCYNVLIGGFCKKNKLDRVDEMLREMEEVGVKPDVVTYNTLISHSSKSGKLDVAHKMIKMMIKDGLVPTVVTYGALIHSYCLNGNIDGAMKIFKDMDSTSKVPPNTVIYNILIESLCKNDDVKCALSLMDDMRVKGVKPNTTTFNSIFKGLREKKWSKKAFELMDSMIEHACNPDYITMEVLTEWLSAIGETENLKKFVEGKKISASITASTAWHSFSSERA